MTTVLECIDDVITNLKEELLNAISKDDNTDENIDFIEALIRVLRSLKHFRRHYLK